MALTVAFNGTNVTTADSTTDWDSITITAPEAWTVEVVHQGAASIGFQASSKDGLGCYEMPTGSFNFDTTHLGQHVFFWINVTMPGTVEALATGGLYLVIGSDQSNYKKFLIAAKDYKEVMEKGFARFVLDPSKTATETVGTPDMTAITLFGAWIDTDEAARIDQLFIDRIDVGWGLTVSGTSTDFWNDLVIGDINLNAGVRDGMYGIAQKYNDTFYLYGQVKIEQGVSANTVISDSGKSVKFVSQQYYNGSAWVDMVSDSFFKLEFVDDATYATQFNDGIAVGTDAGRSGSGISGSLLHDTTFDASGMTNNSSSFLKMYATQLTNFRGGILWHNDVDSLFYGGSIITSGQFVPGIAKMRNLTIAETSDLDAGLLWNESIDIQNCQFIANSIGAAIEFPSAVGTPYDFTNMSFSGNTFDVLNSSGSAIDINNDSNSNGSTSEGSAVTFLSSITLTMIVKDQDGTEVVGAYAYIDDNNITPFIMNTTTNASGIASTGHTAGAVSGSTWRVRKYGYKPFLATVDIASADINLPITLITDPQQI